MTPFPHSAGRRAAVAGLFYPRDPDELDHAVRGFLAAEAGMPAMRAPKAIIAPHAGYVYSGAVAASAYRLLAPVRDRVRRVVLLGPTHRVAVRGLALPECRWFETPLGRIAVDTEAEARLRKLPQVTASATVHAEEHAIEVHLPFLQRALGEFRLVALAVGDAEPDEVTGVLDTLWGGEGTLIVVSSDLSHYLPYGQAQRVDRATAQAIVDLRTDIDHHQACGATPVAGLTLAAQRRGLRAELVDLRNSGDAAGDKQRVVGYGAFAFYEQSTDAR